MYRRFVLILLASSTLLAQPCQDYACDSSRIRAILDTNGLDTVRVEDVVYGIENGRVIGLWLNGSVAIPGAEVQVEAHPLHIRWVLFGWDVSAFEQGLVVRWW